MRRERRRRRASRRSTRARTRSRSRRRVADKLVVGAVRARARSSSSCRSSGCSRASSDGPSRTGSGRSHERYDRHRRRTLERDRRDARRHARRRRRSSPASSASAAASTSPSSRRPSWCTTILRSATEVLSGMPSIVFGYVRLPRRSSSASTGGSRCSPRSIVALDARRALRREVDRARAQPGPARLPRGRRGARHDAGRTLLRRIVLRSAIPGIVDRASSSPSRSRSARRRRCSTPASCSNTLPDRPAHPPPGRLPDLRDLHLLRRPVASGAVQLSLRRLAAPRRPRPRSDPRRPA